MSQHQKNRFVFKPKIECGGGSNCQMRGDVTPNQQNGPQQYTKQTSTSFGLNLGFLQNLNFVHPQLGEHYQPKVQMYPHQVFLLL